MASLDRPKDAGRCIGIDENPVMPADLHRLADPRPIRFLARQDALVGVERVRFIAFFRPWGFEIEVRAEDARPGRRSADAGARSHPAEARVRQRDGGAVGLARNERDALLAELPGLRAVDLR